MPARFSRPAAGCGGGTESAVTCRFDAETAGTIDLPLESLITTSVISTDVVPVVTAWNCTVATLPPVRPARGPDTALRIWTRSSAA
jgi:hypothetical protein